MHFLITAWKATHPMHPHHYIIPTMAHLQHLIDALASQGNCDIITICIVRTPPSNQIKLELPT